MTARILFTIPNFVTAGSGAALLAIVRRLDRTTFEPTICVSRLGGSLEAEIRALGIPLIEAAFTVPALPYASLPRRAWAASRAFRGYKFDLWHSFHYSDDYTEPLIARMAGTRRWIFTKKNMSWGSRAWRVRSMLATRIAAQNSDMISDLFNFRLLRAKTRLVPRGVDLKHFTPSGPAGFGLREKLDLAGKLVIGVVAHIVPVKNYETLISAIALRPHVALVIAGRELDKAYAASLRDHASQLAVADRVHFMGPVEDIPALLREFDVFCLPSHQEGSPVALLEAMACGRACVASDVPGIRDIVENGRSGLLVPPRDPVAFAAAFDAMANPPFRNAYGLAARSRVEQQFSIEREVAAHTALYNEVLRL